MASAKDYQISFPYGTTTPPWSPSSPHRGNDRPTPTGTQVFPGDNRILTGNTGLSTGPHLHTQAGSDPQTQQTFNPTPLEFKPGKVTNTGNASQWGNFVTMQVQGGYITYAHLSQINVKIGDIIKEESMKLSKANVNQLAQIAFNRPARDDEKSVYSSLEATEALQRVLDSEENKTLRTRAQNFGKGVTKAVVVDYINKNLK